MNIFEVFILIFLVVSALNRLVFRINVLDIVLPACSVILCIANLVFIGYRIQMVPAYILALIFLVIDVFIKFKISFKMKKSFKILSVLILVLSLIISIAFPILFPVVQLPKTEGPYSVGTATMSFTDESRKGIFTEKNSSREIAVQIWYPTDDTANKEATNFFPSSVASTYMAERLGLPDIFGYLALVKTHSNKNSDLSTHERIYPVILFSGGFGSFVGQNTVQMEALASNGYIVFSISHPYEDFATIYPSGKILRYNTAQVNRFQNELATVSKSYSGDKSSAEFEKYSIKECQIASESVHIWSDDTIFIADIIEELNSGEIKSIFKNKLDTANMGVFGHSFGGATASQVCLDDSRFKAFINMDGTVFGDSMNRVIEKPFMIMNGNDDKSLIPAGYSSEQTNYYDVTINGAKHSDFMDFTVLLPTFRLVGMLGNVGGYRQEAIMNDYIIAFFNKYLKGTNEPLLDDGMQKYDNVSVEYH